MERLKKTFVLLSFVLLMLIVEMGHSTEQVIIEFIYHDPRKDEGWDPSCMPCLEEFTQFINKNNTMERIRNDYEDRVIVNWTDAYTAYGDALMRSYSVTSLNSLIIRNDYGNYTIIQGDFDETYIRAVIDAYLTYTPPPPPNPPPPLIAIFTTAFVFGFFETFSPCLLALLSFVLSYTIGEEASFKKSFLQAMTFGVGFVFSAILLGLAVGMLFLSVMSFYNIMFWVICIFAILFGINLLGFNFSGRLKIKVETKPIVKELSKKYAFTYAGLLLLGVLFYFLDPCLAPIFVATIPIFASECIFPILLVFGLGVIIPFIGIGFVAGSISKLVRSTYRNRSKIRAISGLIIIGYAVYLIIRFLFF